MKIRKRVAEGKIRDILEGTKGRGTPVVEGGLLGTAGGMAGKAEAGSSGLLKEAGKVAETGTKPEEPPKKPGFWDTALKTAEDFADGGISHALGGLAQDERTEKKEKYDEYVRGQNRLRYEDLKKRKSTLTKKEQEEYIKRGGSMVDSGDDNPFRRK